MFFYIVLMPISTTSGLLGTGNTGKYHQIDVYIYQCDNALFKYFQMLFDDGGDGDCMMMLYMY